MDLAVPQATLQAALDPIATLSSVPDSRPDPTPIDLTIFGGQTRPIVPLESRVRYDLWPGMEGPNSTDIDWEAVPIFAIHVQHMRYLVRYSRTGQVTLDDWRECLLPVTDEDQVEALVVRFADQLAPASLNTLLPVCWTMCNHGRRQGYDRMLRWFRRSGYTSNAAMIGDPEIAAPPTEPMVIYRGTDSPLLDAGLGLSWTPDRDTAEGIALGFKEAWSSDYDATPGWVWSATVDPENVLGWFREPGLDEILIDAQYLRDVTVQEAIRSGWPYDEPATDTDRTVVTTEPSSSGQVRTEQGLDDPPVRRPDFPALLKDWWPQTGRGLDDVIDWEAVPVFAIHVEHMRHLVRCSWEQRITADEWRDCLWPIADHIQLDALMVRHADHIAPASLNALLTVWWHLCHHGRRIGYDRLIRWFRRAGYVTDGLVTGYREIIAPPSAPQEVYRGTNSPIPGATMGPSWTPDLGVAERYARGQHLASSPPAGVAGWVWRATVDPENVLGWFKDPDHDEIVVDPKRLRDVALLKAVEPA